MQKLRIIQGNLIDLALEGEFSHIAHGCNCFKTMGAGIAFHIAEAFPEAFHADKEYRKIGDASKLGTYSKALIVRKSPKGKKVSFTVVNIYTQFLPGRRFEAINLIKGLVMLKNREKPKISHLGVPLIGGGIGGGDRNEIIGVLEGFTKFFPITLVEYNGGSGDKGIVDT